MKKILLFFILSLVSINIFSQTLFTYGNNTVTKEDFLRAYNKNKTAVPDKEKALRDYLDLYINFKLKVQAAKEMHMDTLATLKNDLQNFRSQIEESYLNDESRLNALMQEAFDRSQKDIHVAYFFYPIKDYPDSAAAEKKHLISKEAWSGDLGFITVFSLPYEFENVIYTLKPGEESKAFGTKKGFYIFKNVEQRKAVGKIKAQQILIALPAGASQEDNANTKKLVDSIYHAILDGSDFGDLAKKFSNDRMTYMTGGMLPEFGVGKYDPEFENKVFALQKDGAVTPPFRTQFGFHIVKRLSSTPVPNDKNDPAYLYTLKLKVQQDARVNSAKEKFINNVLKKLEYKKNALVNDNELWQVTDSLIYANKKITAIKLTDKTILFSFKGTNINVGDWIKFVKDYRTSGLFKGETDDQLFKKYISITALDIYRNRLEDFNPEFKSQVQEFKEGNMLFEIMERNVWSKASADSSGLRNYYALHKNQYLWNASAGAILISASNEKAANEAEEKIRGGKNWKQLAEENPSQIQADSGRYELTQLPVKPNQTLSDGQVTEPVVNSVDGTASFVKIIRLYPANQQRNFQEARGLVINDYQNFLEGKWIEQLKKKYPVKVNETVFKSLL